VETDGTWIADHLKHDGTKHGKIVSWMACTERMPRLGTSKE